VKHCKTHKVLDLDIALPFKKKKEKEKKNVCWLIAQALVISNGNSSQGRVGGGESPSRTGRHEDVKQQGKAHSSPAFQGGPAGW